MPVSAANKRFEIPCNSCRLKASKIVKRLEIIAFNVGFIEKKIKPAELGFKD